MNKSDPACRILIADDSALCRGVLVILMETSGYEVVSVKDGREALKVLRSHTFDLAILDNDMPNLGGLGALTEMRTFLPDLPVLVCSGTVSAGQETQYRALKIDALMHKPVDPISLRARVADILSRRLVPVSAPAGAASSEGSVAPFAMVSQLIPLTTGISAEAMALQADQRRLTKFRSVAIVEGGPGSGRFEMALNAAPEQGAHRLVCHAEDLSEEWLERLLKPALEDELPVLLVILESDILPLTHQSVLEQLMRGRLKSLAVLSKRIRLVLCAHRSLSDLLFNEFLLLRATATTCILPDFARRKSDWEAIARSILWRASSGRCTFTPDALAWIGKQDWPGDYVQLHRTIELARRRAGLESSIRTAHMAAAASREPTCTEALFHDLLYILHAGDQSAGAV